MKKEGKETQNMRDNGQLFSLLLLNMTAHIVSLIHLYKYFSQKSNLFLQLVAILLVLSIIAVRPIRKNRIDSNLAWRLDLFRFRWNLV